MKTTLFILFTSVSILFSQETATLQAGKKNIYNDHRISGARLFYQYYETDNKTISNAIVDINSWKIEQEGVSNEELIDGIGVGENILAQIKGPKLMIYDKNYKELANHEFTFKKGYSITKSSYAADPANERVVFYIVVSNNNYGWSEDDATGYFMYFDCKSNMLDIKEIDAKTDDLSINGFLSSEVIEDKVVMDIWAKGGLRWAILDLATGKFSNISFNAEAKYFSTNVVTLNHTNYFIFRSGSSTSQSIFYLHDKIFKLDMENGTGTFVAEMGNTQKDLSNFGSSFVDKNTVRLSCGFLEYSTNKFVNFSMFQGTIRVLFIDEEEPKYIEMETILMSSLYSIYYKMEENKILLMVDGSKQVKNEIKKYEVDLESQEIVSEKTIPAVESGYKGFSMQSFYHNGEKDVPLDYSIKKDKKTGQVTFSKTE
jgi:hypothetical protein